MESLLPERFKACIVSGYFWSASTVFAVNIASLGFSAALTCTRRICIHESTSTVFKSVYLPENKHIVSTTPTSPLSTAPPLNFTTKIIGSPSSPQSIKSGQVWPASPPCPAFVSRAPALQFWPSFLPCYWEPTRYSRAFYPLHALR